MDTEQSPPRIPNRLSALAVLRRIRLVSADLGTRVASPKEAGRVQVEIEWAVSPPKHGTHENLSWLDATVEFRVAVRSEKGEDPSPVVWLNPTFEAHYHFPLDPKPTPSELVEFAEANAVFNLWPYLREFVQSSTARMDLPAVLIPLRRYSGIVGRRVASGKKKSAPKPPGGRGTKGSTAR
jgi:hypothetical protein